ncbi:synergin gamma-like isoform X3 [Argonauta hians]
MINNSRNVDFSQMQTGFNPLQGTPAVSTAAAQFYPVPANSAQYGMVAPGMIAGNPMIAQGIYPVQGTYIATPMAIPTTMISGGHLPPPPPYTPQMAQSYHAQQVNQQFHATMVPGVVHGVVPGQMIAGVPVNAHIVEDQRKGKHFHEQQMKLKLFGRLGVVSSDPDRMIESMFGKVSKSKPKVHIPQKSQVVTTTNTMTTAIDSDPDSFGDFMQGPSSEQTEKPWVEPLEFSSSTPENDVVKPTLPNEEEESKDLMAMMLQYSDLTVSQKAKTFQNKKTLREANPTNLTSRSASYTSSERSRKWQDGDESLSGLFKVEEAAVTSPEPSPNLQSQCTTPDSTTPAVPQYSAVPPFQTLPSWCYLDDDQLPHVFRQVYEASSANDCILTDRLYPILLLSDLPRQTLREIWEVCNMTTPGQLSKQELYLLLSLIAVAQNNQGIPSMEILHQLPSPPVPFLNQASATQITSTPQSPATTSFVASSPTSFAQDTSLSCVGGTLQTNSSSTIGVSSSAPFENAPTSLLETTFGLNTTTTQLSTTQSPAPVFETTLSKQPVCAAPTRNLYGDEDFADFQVAPKITSDSLDQFNMLPGTDTHQVNCGPVTSVTKVETLPELSAEDKYSNVRNFFCSDDSSGTSTNSFDDDYDDFKSADSKPSDDNSQFSTSEQSEGEDFKALDLYVDDFKSRRNMQQVHSPTLPSTHTSFHVGEILFASSTPAPSKSPTPTATSVPPLLSKPPGASAANVGSFASIKVQKTDGCTEFKSADLNAVEDEYTDFKAAPIIHSMKKEIEMATNQLDKYAVFRQIDSIEDELQSVSISSTSSTLNQKCDSTADSSRHSGEENSTENWADFQSAIPTAGANPQSHIPPPYDVAVKNSVLASNVNPVDDDDPGWAEFQASSNSSLNNWADFTQMATNSSETTCIHPPRMDSSSSSSTSAMHSLSEMKQQTESVGFGAECSSSSSTNPSGGSSSLVTIVKDNLQRGEILSLFKVRENVPRENIISHSDMVSRNDGIEMTRRNSSKKDKTKVKIDNTAISCQNFQQQQQQQPSAITASNVSLNLSSDIDLFHEPPPLDDSIEVEDDFGGFSHGIDSFDFTKRAGFPASVSCPNSRPGLTHIQKIRSDEVYSSENPSSCQVGNFDFADEDSHSSKDTDSLSWQDNNKFQKEDSQSVSSLELSYNSAGRQNQRDPDMAADSQSVSSSEFPAFETLQKQEITLESKSLDSLEFRNDDQGWGEMYDNNGDNVPDDNKNRSVQNITAETPVGSMPTLAQPVPPQTVVNKENLIARDRYSSVIKDVQGSDHHCHEWTKCLDKCYQRIKEANSVFNSISSSCVCNEVIKSCQGADYIMAIIEIYRVVCKITVTMRMSVLTNERLETLLKDIDLAWNNLAAFLSASSLLSEVTSFNYTSAVLKTDDTSSQLKACGVCLLNVDVFDRISTDNERAAKLIYSGRQYHTTCANFWVNCVDSMLPNLKLPQLI